MKWSLIYHIKTIFQTFMQTFGLSDKVSILIYILNQPMSTLEDRMLISRFHSLYFENHLSV